MRVKRFLIVVEGIADEKFFGDYYYHLFGEKAPEGSIITTAENEGTGGYKKIETETVLQALRRNTDNDGRNIVIFDSDDSVNERRQEMQMIKEKHSVEFELFLLPNDQDRGALEDLLENIINSDNKPIMECWHNYEQELMRVRVPARNPLTIPANKTKIYAYLETLLGTSKSQKKLIKEANRNYRNSLHWNLDAEYLRPLKDFLTRVLCE